MSQGLVCPIPDTLTALQRIREALAAAQGAHPLAPAWLIMPGGLVPEWQRRQGSCLNVRTGSFIHVSQWVLDQVGEPPALLSGPRRQRFLQHLVQAVHADTPLQALGDCVALPGFSRHLGLWLDDMKQQEIALARFQAYAEAASDPRERDLARLYQAYEERLRASPWLDEAGAMARVCQVLRERGSAFLSLAFMGIMGYVEFSPLQVHLMRGLAAGAQASRVFVPAGPASRDLATDMAVRLEFGCEKAAGEIDRRHSPERQQLEAPSQEQEVRGVLRAVKRLWVEERVPLANIALCVSRLDAYVPLLDAVAEEYGVPLDLPVALAHHPLCVTLRQILTLFPNLPWRQGWQVLQSPFLDQSLLSPEELDAVYRMTVACGVIQGQDQWDAPFTQDYDWEAARLPLPAWTEEELSDLHARLQALWAALQPRSGQSCLDWLHDLVAAPSAHPVRLRIPETWPDSERAGGQYALDAVRQTVAELQAEAQLLPFADAAAARQCLEQRLADVTYRPRRRGEAIRVLAFAESWMLPADRLFVLGMNERALPHTPRAGPFYAWSERPGHALPLPQHDPRVDELRWACLQANCRTALHLSRPTDVADMPSTAPSPYWQTDVPCTQMERLPVPLPGDAASPSELLQALLRFGSEAYPLALRERIAKARTLAAIHDRRHSYRAPGRYEGVLRAAHIRRDLQDRFGPNHSWSPTALGDYAQCPMGFLVKHVLDMTPPPAAAPGLDARIRGLLLHAILHDLYQWIRDEQVPMTVSQWERIRAYLDRICDEHWDMAAWKYMFQPYPLSRFELRELKLYAQWCIRNELAETEDRVEWEPFELEWRIAGAGIVLTAGVERPFRIRGVVDRLDRNREGRVRVIDYKTRKSPYTAAELQLATVNQAVLYRMAAMEAGHDVAASGYRLLAQTKDGRLRNQPKDPEATAMIERIQAHQAAMRQGDFRNAPAVLDESGRKCTSYCELADFCQPTYTSHRKGASRDGP